MYFGQISNVIIFENREVCLTKEGCVCVYARIHITVFSGKI